MFVGQKYPKYCGWDNNMNILSLAWVSSSNLLRNGFKTLLSREFAFEHFFFYHQHMNYMCITITYYKITMVIS